MTTAAAIAKIRNDYGASQIAWSGRTGYSSTQIVRWETGRISPRLFQLRDLCDAGGVSLVTFAGWVEAKP
jgi:predicted transcriptional regulator